MSDGSASLGEQLGYRASRLGRRATASTRALPDFVIVGAAKCGTTSLYRYLVEHRLAFGPQIKEVHFVDRQHNWDKGTDWYRSWFPTRRALRRAGTGAICGEATPNYLAHPDAATRLRSVVPDARLIVLLREPIDRTWSQYRWQQRFGGETLPLGEALRAEVERAGDGFEMMGADRETRNRFISHGYLARSRYADQLVWWFDAYPRDQLLLLRSEDLFSRPADVYKQTCEFLGLPDAALPAFAVANEGTGDRETGAAIDADLRAWLDDQFAEPNRRLADLTDGAITWP